MQSEFQEFSRNTSILMKKMLAVQLQIADLQTELVTLAHTFLQAPPKQTPATAGKPAMHAIIRPCQAAHILKINVRSADRKFREIREKYNIPAREPITIEEFCRFTRLSQEQVIFMLNQ